MFSLRGNYDFVEIYVEFSIIYKLPYIVISSPVGASLYNIGTILCSQRTTSSSSKCRKKIRWRRICINNWYEEKTTTGYPVGFQQKLNRGSSFCVNNVQYCRAHSWTSRNGVDMTSLRRNLGPCCWQCCSSCSCFGCYWRSGLRPADNWYVLKTTHFHRMESFYLDHGAYSLHLLWTKYTDNGLFILKTPTRKLWNNLACRFESNIAAMVG